MNGATAGLCALPSESVSGGSSKVISRYWPGKDAMSPRPHCWSAGHGELSARLECANRDEQEDVAGFLRFPDQRGLKNACKQQETTPHRTHRMASFQHRVWCSVWRLRMRLTATYWSQGSPAWWPGPCRWLRGNTCRSIHKPTPNRPISSLSARNLKQTTRENRRN